MKIKDLTASLVVHPLPGDFHPAWGPGLVQRELPLTLIELKTESGITGYGALPASGQEGVVGINTFVKESLLGVSIYNTERIGQILENASLRMTWPWGVEMAVWDAIGKQIGLPVYKLMGGYRDRIKVYASLGEVKTAGERVKDVLRLQDEGFSGVKLRFHSEDPAEDIRMAREVVEAAGDTMDIMVDANQADALPGSENVNQWDYYTALKVGQELEELGITWLEEPLPRFDIEGLQKLSSRLEIPLAGGEKNQRMPEFKRLIVEDCYQILQGDCSFSAGLFQLRKIAGVAEMYHKKFIPHTWSNGLGLFANLQLAASLPNCPWFEYPYEKPGWDHEANSYLFTHGLEIENGYIKVPSRPGLGFEIDPEKVENCRI